MPKKTYMAAADLLRVISVFLIACFHIWQQSWLDARFWIFGREIYLTSLIRRGYMMVDLMLLLSGFLLFLPYAGGRSVPVRQFYGKRLRRIVPSYVFAVLAALIFALCRSGGAPYVPLGKDLLLHLTFTQTFTRPTYLWTSLNVALWTVCIEMQFYLLFPWIARQFSRRPALTFGCMLGMGLLCRGLLLRVEDVSVLFNQLPCMIDLYACGMLAAYLSVNGKKRPGTLLSAAGSLVCLIGILWILIAQNPANDRELNQLQMLWRLPLGILGGGFLYCGSGWGARLDRIVGNRALRFLSGISYNFYIWHQYLAVKLKEWHLPPYLTDMPQQYEGHVWQVKYTWLCFLAALAAAALTTYLIEKPCARWLEKRKFPL